MENISQTFENFFFIEMRQLGHDMGLCLLAENLFCYTNCVKYEQQYEQVLYRPVKRPYPIIIETP